MLSPLPATSAPPIVPALLPLPGKFALTLGGVVSAAECQSWIDASEARGYVQAAVNFGDDTEEIIMDYRRSSRCIIDSAACANSLFARIEHALPAEFVLNGRTFHLVGLNERLRFLRYEKGDFFAPHCDGYYVRMPQHCNGASENANPSRAGERSFVTVQLYLNEGFDGGETTFFLKGACVPYVPRAGSVLVFEHKIQHEGSILRAGKKYAVRTDAMYSEKEGAKKYGTT